MTPQVDRIPAASGALFSRRNLVLLAVAIVTIGAGYAVLVGGSAGMAAVLLVVGYCVLFPVALIA
jgi:hypothetical protein